IISKDISKEDKDEYEKKLRNMLEFMQNANKPVHFVVTKWDRVARANFSLPKILPQVQMYLRKIPFFQNFVETQGQTGAVVQVQMYLRKIPSFRNFVETQVQTGAV